MNTKEATVILNDMRECIIYYGKEKIHSTYYNNREDNINDIIKLLQRGEKCERFFRAYKSNRKK